MKRSLREDSDGDNQFGRVDRLYQVHLKPALKDLHSILGTRVRGQRRSRYLADRLIVRLANPFEQLEAVCIGHPDISDHNVRANCLERRDRFVRRLHDDDVRATASEGLADERARVGVVVSGKDSKSHQIRQPSVRSGSLGRRLSSSFRRRFMVDNHQRQSHAERRALIASSARRMNCPAVQFDQVTHDGETKPDAGVLTCRPTVGLPETLEDVRQEIWRNSDTGIADDDLDVRIDPFESHLDDAVLWREFDGIRHEVPDDLLQSIGITRNRRGGRIKNGVNTNVLGLRSRKDGLDRVGDDAREIDRLNVQTNLAGDDSGDIKNVLDDLRQCRRVPLHGLERVRVLVRVSMPDCTNRE